MESRQYGVPPAGSNGKCGTRGRKAQHYHSGLDRYGLYESADGLYSVRPERYSYNIIKETGKFVINLTTEALTRATDFCGVRSGRDVDKFKETHLTAIPGPVTGCPMIDESPVNIECTVTEIKELGSHHMFLAKVEAVHVSEEAMDEKGKFHLNETGLLAYSHGEYLGLGKKLGTFGYSVKKPAKKRR